MQFRRYRPIILIAAIAAALVALPAAALAATTAEKIIWDDTVLTEDHHGFIRIRGEGTTLDCAGHGVIGNGAKHGIYVSADDVTVSNGAVSGALSGIVMFGYRMDSVLVGWDGLRLENNRAFDNSVNGVNLNFGTDVTAISNKAFLNGEEGFKIRSTSQSEFIGNKAQKNGWSGFFITEASTDNTFDSNKATKNEWGFSVESPVGSNAYIDNVCNQNIYGDFTQAGACD